MGVSNNRFLDACYGRNNGSIPIWVMRQAGRYLPEYREVRAKISFEELCQSPDIIAEVVKQPIDRFGMDAVILFSDIMTMLTPMGVRVTFPDGGPKIDKPLQSLDDVKRLTDFDIEAGLGFVLRGIRNIKKILPDTPLIGFIGSQFTLSCYLTRPEGTKNFDHAKMFLHNQPKAAEEMFERLIVVMTRYLQAQIDAGAEVVQMFCSWDGILSYDDFRRWTVEPARRIFNGLKENNVPRILFINNYVTGNAYYGIGLNDCVVQSKKVVEQIF
ncbi:MAG: uroporphyrinogen decarboxylase [candidate division Zixibacteria bacterium]|nr:uroporphyrinogen decarboxylase [candidate division Zixibacteria bacterium]